MKAISMSALAAVIERHKLEPDQDGNYQITDEMAEEAAVIDEADGNRPPSSLEDLKAMIEGRPNSGNWEEVDLNKLPSGKMKRRLQ